MHIWSRSHLSETPQIKNNILASNSQVCFALQSQFQTKLWNLNGVKPWPCSCQKFFATRSIVPGCYLRFQWQQSRQGTRLGTQRNEMPLWVPHCFRKVLWCLQTVIATKPYVKYCADISQDYLHGTNWESWEERKEIRQGAKPSPWWCSSHSWESPHLDQNTSS